MRKSLLFILASLFLVVFTSMGIHKFYVSVYQVNYNQEKKALQITSRIFIDDLDNALEKKYGKKLYLGTSKELPEAETLVKKYLLEKFSIKVNGKTKTINYLGKEIEEDVLICYYNVQEVGKISTLDVYNTLLIDYISEQQNIIHTNISGVKKSLLLTENNINGTLNF